MGGRAIEDGESKLFGKGGDSAQSLKGGKGMDREEWEALVKDAIEGAQSRLLAAARAYVHAKGPGVKDIDLSPLRRKVGKVELEWPHPRNPLAVRVRFEGISLPGISLPGEELFVHLAISPIGIEGRAWREAVPLQENSHEQEIRLLQIHQLHPRWVADLLLFYEEVSKRFTAHWSLSPNGGE